MFFTIFNSTKYRKKIKILLYSKAYMNQYFALGKGLAHHVTFPVQCAARAAADVVRNHCNFPILLVRDQMG